jgi:hypothetical protein
MSMSISESNVAVGLRAAFPLTLRAVDDEGNGLIGVRGVTWSSSDISKATVDANGNVSGVALGGPVTITAKRQGLTASVLVTVTPASIHIAPNVETIPVGTAVQFTATPLDAEGLAIDVDDVMWIAASAHDVASATISPDGLLTVHAPGIVSVTASIAGRTRTVEVGIPSVHDGRWMGMAATNAGVEFTVRYGVVSAFRMPTTIRQKCTRERLTLQSAPVVDGRFVLSMTGIDAVVSGVFPGDGVMTGTYGEIGTAPGCSGVGEGPVPAATFTAFRE